MFARAEFAKACGRRANDRAVTELLKYHLRAGNIRRIARGVFASVAKGAFPATTSVDRILAASRLRAGAVIAYRSALELHGCAATRPHEIQLIARGEPGILEKVEFICRFVSPPRNPLSSREVTTIDRQGLAVDVTTLERTLVDLFDRYDLAGGAEDLLCSLDLVVDLVAERAPPLDIDALIRSAKHLSSAAAVGALGFWLDQESRRLGVDDAVLEDLRLLAPRHCRYALGATPGSGRAATGWNVILPSAIVERYLED